MSTRYPGGFITRNPVAPTSASASGIWTQDQVLQYVRSGTWPQVYVPIYIEDVFSTYLYTGNGSTQTITNNIDLSGKGGAVWIKSRDVARNHLLSCPTGTDSDYLVPNATDAKAYDPSRVSAFTTSGFSVGSSAGTNANAEKYASWTFREQAKFFDVVTYTGNGTTQAIAHNLGSVPGFIIVKRTNSAEDWWCFHRYDFTYRFKLNATNAAVNTTSVKYLGNNVIDVAPTSTNFTVGDTGGLNGSGDSFVAYLFAHDAGGFGATGSDNVISCGSFTTVANNASVTLGWEPQWVITKKTSATSDWQIFDNMRGMGANTSGEYALMPNSSAAENENNVTRINATGFTNTQSDGTYIYIAIRRGPMKTPTSGTSVFSPVVYTGTNVDNRLVDMSLLTDMAFVRQRNDTVLGGMVVGDRLRGDPYLLTGTTNAEVSDADSFMTPTAGYGNSWSAMNGFGVGNDATSKLNASTTSNNQIAEGFRRAPGFFDVVCYSGTGAATTRAHNLGVVPELMISKRRSGTAEDWYVYHAAMGAAYYMFLNLTNAKAGPNSGPWNSTAPTSSVFSTGDWYESGATYVTYLFASCPGVSKVGSYTGTGTTQVINCGFTAGSRFVLIKRTDSTGDWYVWDSARGIVSGNDPYLLLNSTAAEVTNTDYIDTDSTGFEITSTAPAAINANGGTFIFLAIA